MIVSFFESLKYVGHLWPISFLRIFVGYYYFEQALEKVQGEFLQRPVIAAMIHEWLPSSSVPEWYRVIIEQIVLPHWEIFAYIVVAVQFFIGGSYLIGYMVRPASLLGIFFCLNGIHQSGLLEFQELMMAVFFTLGWIGAGRCLGIDYFFFKRRRGIWW